MSLAHSRQTPPAKFSPYLSSVISGCLTTLWRGQCISKKFCFRTSTLYSLIEWKTLPFPPHLLLVIKLAIKLNIYIHYLRIILTVWCLSDWVLLSFFFFVNTIMTLLYGSLFVQKAMPAGIGVWNDHLSACQLSQSHSHQSLNCS
jgi:hypothetical protein